MLRILEATVEEFSIPFAEAPLVVTTASTCTTFSHRNGAYLRSRAISSSNETISSIGEVVEPVFLSPSASSDSLTIVKSAVAFLRKMAQKMIGFEIDSETWQDSLESIFSHVNDEDAMDAHIACFAVEQALLSLIATSQKRDVSCVISEYIFGHRPSTPVRAIKINSMFNARQGANLSTLHGCVKIKVGSASPTADADVVNSVVSQRNGHTSPWLRLDANQMWALGQYHEFAARLSPESVAAIEYIEEPFFSASLEDLEAGIQHLQSTSPQLARIPIALDESLLSQGIEDVLNRNASLRIVHKTSLHGLRKHRELIRRNHNRITITCTFETGICLSFLCAVAAAVNPQAFHGISPFLPMARNDASTSAFEGKIERSKAGLLVSLPISLE